MGTLQQIEFRTKFMVENCCQCGISFCFTEDFYQQKKADGKSFYCPNGHSQHYSESDVQRLQKQLEQKELALTRQKEWAESYREQRDKAQRSASAMRGQLTKTKNRIGNGVCPCCNRTFANLQKHMHSKHPEYKKPQT